VLIQDVIATKRDGGELSAEQIESLVSGFAAGDIPDYQMSALLMAAFIRGLSSTETFELTRSMIASGSTLDLSSVPGVKIDKHSTGGVGDKTTLVVVPMLAACGLVAAKLSGRGLGFTGGTIDKLESIPGFTTSLTLSRILAQAGAVGAVMAGQSPDLVPADKKIYALRDVTGTVESIPLIAASVMSKKIACGADVILLDVKVGSGAFMRSIDRARELAATMIGIGSSLGRKVEAVITDMSQPLGHAIGNALEVAEAIDTLHGRGSDDLRGLCVELVALALVAAGRIPDMDGARPAALNALGSGAALMKFTEIVSAQGGDARVVDDPTLLPTASIVSEVVCEWDGNVAEIECSALGVAAGVLGAGREKLKSRIDYSAGIVVLKKLGDRVARGEPIALLHGNDAGRIAVASEIVRSAYRPGIGGAAPSLIHEIVR